MKMGEVFLVEVNVKRNTGLMGGATKVAILVDGQETAKLKNNEEHVIVTDKAEINIRAKSGFMKSRLLQTTSSANIEIKVNLICLLLFIISIALIFTASMSDVREMKLIFSMIGLIGVIATFIMSVTSWFVLRASEQRPSVK